MEEKISSLGPEVRIFDEALFDEVLLALVLQRLDALLYGLLGHGAGAAGVAVVGDLEGRRLQGAHPEREDVNGGSEGDGVI